MLLKKKTTTTNQAESQLFFMVSLPLLCLLSPSFLGVFHLRNLKVRQAEKPALGFPYQNARMS